jgi:hypothetical protein
LMQRYTNNHIALDIAARRRERAEIASWLGVCVLRVDVWINFSRDPVANFGGRRWLVHQINKSDTTEVDLCPFMLYWATIFVRNFATNGDVWSARPRFIVLKCAQRSYLNSLICLQIYSPLIIGINIMRKIP